MAEPAPLPVTTPAPYYWHTPIASYNHCADCKTTTTPLWRKFNMVMYCNACGIRRRRGSKVIPSKGDRLKICLKIRSNDDADDEAAWLLLRIRMDQHKRSNLAV